MLFRMLLYVILAGVLLSGCAGHRQVHYNPLNSEEHVMCTGCFRSGFEDLERELVRFHQHVDYLLGMKNKVANFYAAKEKHHETSPIIKSSNGTGGIEVLFRELYR